MNEINDNGTKSSAGRRPTKNEKRRMKKKSTNKKVNSSNSNINGHIDHDHEDDDFDVEVEYIAADYEAEAKEAGLSAEALEQLRSVFTKFAKPEELVAAKKHSDDEKGEDEQKESKDIVGGQTGVGEITDSETQKLSKRKKKMLSRLSVAELKQLVSRPDVVEVHDVTSSNPKLLIHLKAQRNTVPVPRHWCHIRKYLQGKRGIEKLPFQLPEFIAETGIAKIRDAVMEQEALRKGKQKARERVRPKMGKIDIDYQVLHDAFFKYQTKPKMTGHGDLYYEGKELEVNLLFISHSVEAYSLMLSG